MTDQSNFSVSRSAIRSYAELTDDFNPIHLDDDFAATTPMGRVIAHGTLSLNAMLDRLSALIGRDALLGAAIEARFSAPVWRDEQLTISVDLSEDAGAYMLRALRSDGVEAISAMVTPAKAVTPA